MKTINPKELTPKQLLEMHELFKEDLSDILDKYPSTLKDLKSYYEGKEFTRLVYSDYRLVGCALGEILDLRIDDELDGAIRDATKETKIAYLEMIAVDPLMKGMGIGKQLLQEFITFANTHIIMVGTNKSRNYKFYEHMNFHKVAQQNSSGSLDYVYSSNPKTMAQLKTVYRQS